MADTFPSEAQALLARSAKLRLFAMLRRTARPDLLPGMLGAHLRWMIDREKEGHIFLSGPVAPRSGTSVPDGLTIIRAATLADAEEIARDDPFVRAGIVTFEIGEWTVNEGAITLTVTLSDTTVTL